MEHNMISHYIAPLPYTYADALLAEIFMMHYADTGKEGPTRRAISSGSCIYSIPEMMRSDPPEPGDDKIGQIYLREAFNNQTYIRILSADVHDRLDEILGLYVWNMNNLAKRDEEEQAQIPPVNSIHRSESTQESWSRGATYEEPLPAPDHKARVFRFLEDKRAFEDLRANPDKRDEIWQRWGRAVGRNKNRTITPASLSSTWRRLVKWAKEAGE
jgi:hypothetical protein